MDGGDTDTATASSATASSATSTNNNNKNGGDDQKVSFYKLFTFADRLDAVLMTVGSISAVANGLSQPIMTLIFGQMINSFGSSDQSDVVRRVAKVPPTQFFSPAFTSFVTIFGS